jgi:hypothetical protein
MFSASSASAAWSKFLRGLVGEGVMADSAMRA